jgi:hypothetical protein
MSLQKSSSCRILGLTRKLAPVRASMHRNPPCGRRYLVLSEVSSWRPASVCPRPVR